MKTEDSRSEESLSLASDISSASSSDEDSEVAQPKMDLQNINQKKKSKKLPKCMSYKKTTTLAFFYVGLVFIIVALPTSLFNACAFWYLLISGKVSEVFTVGYWVSQTFYGFVFLINPCLYAASNRYVKGTVRNVSNRLFGWYCCCKRPN